MLGHWSEHHFPHKEHTGAPEILAEQETFISTSAESMQMFHFLNTSRAHSHCTKTPPQFLRLSSPGFYSAPFLHGVSWGWKMIFLPRKSFSVLSRITFCVISCQFSLRALTPRADWCRWAFLSWAVPWRFSAPLSHILFTSAFREKEFFL